MEKNLFQIEVELAKSWIELAKMFLQLAGFLGLIYILLTNIGIDFAKLPSDIYWKSVDNPEINLTKISNELSPPYYKLMNKIIISQKIFLSLAIMSVLLSFFFWEEGRKRLYKLKFNIKNKELLQVNHAISCQRSEANSNRKINQRRN